MLRAGGDVVASINPEKIQVANSAGLGTGGPHTPEVTESQAPSRGLGLSAQSQPVPAFGWGLSAQSHT